MIAEWSTYLASFIHGGVWCRLTVWTVSLGTRRMQQYSLVHSTLSSVLGTWEWKFSLVSSPPPTMAHNCTESLGMRLIRLQSHSQSKCEVWALNCFMVTCSAPERQHLTQAPVQGTHMSVYTLCSKREREEEIMTIHTSSLVPMHRKGSGHETKFPPLGRPFYLSSRTVLSQAF